MSEAGKMRRIDRNMIEVRIGNGKPRLYLVPQEKTRSIELLISEYRKDGSEESLSLDEAFKHLNEKYSRQGNLLCGMRLKEGWTQVELAAKVGSSQANIAAIENGRRGIGKRLAYKLAQVFDTHFEIFLEE